MGPHPAAGALRPRARRGVQRPEGPHRPHHAPRARLPHGPGASGAPEERQGGAARGARRPDERAVLARPLAQHPRMSEEDSLTVQLVIVFVRNLLVPADSEDPSWNGKEREDVIQCLFDTNVVDLLVAAAQHTDEAPFPM